MNMHSSKLNYYLFAVVALLLASCTKERLIGYDVEQANVIEDKSRKSKQKNDAEFISILYTNLYQTAHRYFQAILFEVPK